MYLSFCQPSGETIMAAFERTGHEESEQQSYHGADALPAYLLRSGDHYSDVLVAHICASAEPPGSFDSGLAAGLSTSAVRPYLFQAYLCRRAARFCHGLDWQPTFLPSVFSDCLPELPAGSHNLPACSGTDCSENSSGHFKGRSEASVHLLDLHLPVLPDTDQRRVLRQRRRARSACRDVRVRG